MIQHVSQCVCCGQPCLGNTCPYYSVRVLTCDKCGEDADALYWYNGMQLCRDCVIDSVFDEISEVEDDE